MRLRKQGFSDEDIWDIGAIAAFFALSNRMANMIGMRPNDEFYLLGTGASEERSGLSFLSSSGWRSCAAYVVGHLSANHCGTHNAGAKKG